MPYSSALELLPLEYTQHKEMEEEGDGDGDGEVQREGDERRSGAAE